MEQIAAIFKQLGADETVAYQFIIFLVLFLILKFIFWNKLQFVIELRESKTTKLEEGANKKFSEAEKLKDNYNSHIEEANKKAQELLNQKKNEVIQSQRTKVKEVGSKLDGEVATQREAFMKELEGQREAIMKTADGLAGDLVSKLTN